MNILAHLFLAGNDEGLIVGNFIADSVKGSKYLHYPETIKKGILMHREIDSFSDHNAVYLRSVHRLQPMFGKYSGIINDMFTDYFLANNWAIYSDTNFELFCTNSYTILHKYENMMPEESKTMLKYMSEKNWLHSYKSIEGIKHALTGMSNRMKYYFPMDKASDLLKTAPEAYLEDFTEFFPILMKHVIIL